MRLSMSTKGNSEAARDETISVGETHWNEKLLLPQKRLHSSSQRGISPR